jgi:hypothetical protein
LVTKENTNIHVKVVNEIGPEKVSAIVTDSTGNTRLAREQFTTIVPTAFNLPDIAHFLNNLIKDLVRIDYFKDPISVVRYIIAKLNKAHLGKTALDKTRAELGIGRGLEAVGKTRFGTIIRSSESVRRNIQPIKLMVERETYDLEVRDRPL